MANLTFEDLTRLLGLVELHERLLSNSLVMGTRFGKSLLALQKEYEKLREKIELLTAPMGGRLYRKFLEELSVDIEAKLQALDEDEREGRTRKNA